MSKGLFTICHWLLCIVYILCYLRVLKSQSVSLVFYQSSPRVNSENASVVTGCEYFKGELWVANCNAFLRVYSVTHTLFPNQVRKLEAASFRYERRCVSLCEEPLQKSFPLESTASIISWSVHWKHIQRRIQIFGQSTFRKWVELHSKFAYSIKSTKFGLKRCIRCGEKCMTDWSSINRF